MFPARYFAERFFPVRYWPSVGATAVAPPAPTTPRSRIVTMARAARSLFFEVESRTYTMPRENRTVRIKD